MRPLLFWVLLLGSFSAFAQAPAVAAPPPAPMAAPAATAANPDAGAVLVFNDWYLPAYSATAGVSDTTGALLSLFRKRRYAGFLYTVPLMIGLSLALPIASKDQYGNKTVAAEAISPPIGTVVLLGTVAAFIVHANKFNKAHLVALDKSYAAGQPLPRKYRSQLNANHFAEAAFLREALAQQMAREQLAAPGK